MWATGHPRATARPSRQATRAERPSTNRSARNPRESIFKASSQGASDSDSRGETVEILSVACGGAVGACPAGVWGALPGRHLSAQQQVAHESSGWSLQLSLAAAPAKRPEIDIGLASQQLSRRPRLGQPAG